MVDESSKINSHLRQVNLLELDLSGLRVLCLEIPMTLHQILHVPRKTVDL